MIENERICEPSVNPLGHERLARDNRFLNPKSSYERIPWRHLHVGSSLLFSCRSLAFPFWNLQAFILVCSIVCSLRGIVSCPDPCALVSFLVLVCSIVCSLRGIVSCPAFGSRFIFQSYLSAVYISSGRGLQELLAYWSLLLDSCRIYFSQRYAPSFTFCPPLTTENLSFGKPILLWIHNSWRHLSHSRTSHLLVTYHTFGHDLIIWYHMATGSTLWIHLLGLFIN